MPIILYDYAISTINGPVSICVLRSKIKSVGYDNTLILFGDYHSNKVYDPISTNESNFNYDFIEKLNIFAENHTTEFYLEEWFSYNLSRIERPNIKQEIRDKRLFMLDPDNTDLLKEIKKRNPKQTVFQKENSMLEFAKLYQGCFYKKLRYDVTLCPYKNIIWQYTDVRRNTNKNQFENVIDNGKIDFEFFVNMLYIKKHEIYKLHDNTDEHISNKSEKLKLIDVYINDPENYYNEDFTPITERDITNKDIQRIIERIEVNVNVIQFLKTLYYSFKNHKLYIKMLFSSKTINKQYSKLTNKYDLESFEKLFKYILQSKYLKTTAYQDFNNIIRLIELLMHFIISKNVEDKNKYLKMINELDITYYEVSHLTTYFQALTSINLDFYFILRMNRFHINNKLMCLYIGNFHTNTIRHYLTEIVKTYDIMYYYLDERHKPDFTDTKVIIPDEIVINLNKMIQPIKTPSRHRPLPNTRRRLKTIRMSKSNTKSNTKSKTKSKTRPKTSLSIISLPLNKNRQTI